MSARVIYTCIILPLQGDEKKLELGQKSAFESQLTAFITGIMDREQFSILSNDSQKLYTTGPYTYAYLYQSLSGQLAITVTSVTDARLIFKFTEDLLQQYNITHDSDRLNQLLVKYNTLSDESLSTVGQIQDNLNDTKERMRLNLMSVLEQGDSLSHIEELAMDTERGAWFANDYAKEVKSVVWWRRTKFRVCLCFTCIIIIMTLAIVLAIVLYILLR
jgi:hypothetical protein